MLYFHVQAYVYIAELLYIILSTDERENPFISRMYKSLIFNKKPFRELLFHKGSFAYFVPERVIMVTKGVYHNSSRQWCLGKRNLFFLSTNLTTSVRLSILLFAPRFAEQFLYTLLLLTYY